MKGFAQGLTLLSFRVRTEQCPCMGGSPFSGGSVPGGVGCSWVAFSREILGVTGPLFIQSSSNHCKELFSANFLAQKLCGGESLFTLSVK